MRPHEISLTAQRRARFSNSTCTGQTTTKLFIIFIISCLPTAAITQIFSGDSEGTSLGSVSANTTNTTKFILRANGGNQTISAKNLTHVFRRLPALQTLVIGAFAVLSDEPRAPDLPRLLSIYIRGIGAEAEADTKAGARAGMLCGASDWNLESITTGPRVRLSRIVKMLARTSLPIRKRRGHWKFG